MSASRHIAPSSPVTGCSHDVPLCVSGAPSDVGPMLLALEDAWKNLRIYGLSAPDPLLTQRALHVVLDEEAGDVLLLGHERAPLSRVDRASAEVRIPKSAREGCERSMLAHRTVLHASMQRTNPALSPQVADGLARALASTLSGCLPAARSLNHPEESFFKRPEETAAFFQWLDAHYSKQPLAVLHDLLALSVTETEPLAQAWKTEPDMFDVMKESFSGLKFKGSKYEEVLVDYAVDRALTSKDHWVDWELEWPAAPRRLLAARAVEPLGASLVKIRAAGATLRVELAWEFESRFRWVVLKRNAQGEVVNRTAIPTPERATEVQITIRNVDQATELWLVGLNLGDPKRPLDPDELATEPHKWTLTVAPE